MDNLLQLLAEYLRWLSQIFTGDLHVFGQWWLYAPLLIPFFFYTIFFLAKWVLITLPIWLPLKLAFSPLRIVSKIILTDRNKKPISDEALKAINFWAKKSEMIELRKMHEADED
jgi:hypothetical protein